MKSKDSIFLSAVLVSTGVIAVGSLSFRHYKKRIEELKDKLTKEYEFYGILVKWLRIHNSDKTVVEYFADHGYRNAAIYGMRELGECLYDELSKSQSVSVEYIIDSNTDIVYRGKRAISPEDELPNVDVIVVTAMHYYDSIKEKLANKTDCMIISIEDVLFG